MDIRNIAFSELKFGDGICQGLATLLTASGAMHCACRVAVRPGQPIVTMQRALLNEALRQIGRMPEFRRRLARITLNLQHDHSALPLAA